MQVVLATLTSAILSCSFNKIFNDFQIKTDTKHFKILFIESQKNHMKF